MRETISGQRISTKGRIVILLPIAAANAGPWLAISWSGCSPHWGRGVLDN